jgi:hypothetical protein
MGMKGRDRPFPIHNPSSANGSVKPSGMSLGGVGEVPILCATLPYAKKTMPIKYDLFIATGFYQPFPFANTARISKSFFSLLCWCPLSSWRNKREPPAEESKRFIPPSFLSY